MTTSGQRVLVHCRIYFFGLAPLAKAYPPSLRPISFPSISSWNVYSYCPHSVFKGWVLSSRFGLVGAVAVCSALPECSLHSSSLCSWPAGLMVVMGGRMSYIARLLGCFCYTPTGCTSTTKWSVMTEQTLRSPHSAWTLTMALPIDSSSFTLHLSSSILPLFSCHLGDNISE